MVMVEMAMGKLRGTTNERQGARKAGNYAAKPNRDREYFVCGNGRTFRGCCLLMPSGASASLFLHALGDLQRSTNGMYDISMTGLEPKTCDWRCTRPTASLRDTSTYVKREPARWSWNCPGHCFYLQSSMSQDICSCSRPMILKGKLPKFPGSSRSFHLKSCVSLHLPNLLLPSLEGGNNQYLASQHLSSVLCLF